MRSLRDGAEDYLTLRRGLGFKLKGRRASCGASLSHLKSEGRHGSRPNSRSNGRRSLNISNLPSGLPV